MGDIPIADYENIKSHVETISGFLVPGQEKYLFDKVKSLPDDAVIVEIGSYKGRSTTAMAYACKGTNKKIHCIDVWDSTLDMWKKNIQDNNLSEFVIPYQGFSHQVLNSYELLNAVSGIDFVFIDGSHKYEDVLKDFEMIFPMVKDNGWIAFHDVVLTFQGVEKVWNEFAKCILSNHEYSTTIACGQKNTTVCGLPINFFTIVLNGEPFIRQHIETFKKISTKWHWHIVEGVASLTHDTHWGFLNGGRITDDLHNNGLSNDGTTEYLNELKKQYPENITIYRKPFGKFWDGKIEMVNAPLENIKEECLLWQIDVDEDWTLKQTEGVVKMFAKQPNKTAAFYMCVYFVGTKLIITSKNTYGNHLDYEWIRTWRFKPNDFWSTHEPPCLCRDLSGQKIDVAKINPFKHAETEANGFVFNHYAYVIEKQLLFKEKYYGYKNAVKGWEDLQSEKTFPVFLKNYFPWVNDETIVNRLDKDSTNED